MAIDSFGVHLFGTYTLLGNKRQKKKETTNGCVEVNTSSRFCVEVSVDHLIMMFFILTAYETEIMLSVVSIYVCRFNAWRRYYGNNPKSDHVLGTVSDEPSHINYCHIDNHDDLVLVLYTAQQAYTSIFQVSCLL